MDHSSSAYLSALKEHYGLDVHSGDVAVQSGYESSHLAFGSVFMKKWDRAAGAAVAYKQAAVQEHLWRTTRLRSSLRVPVPFLHQSKDGQSLISVYDAIVCVQDKAAGKTLRQAWCGSTVTSRVFSLLGDLAGRVAVATRGYQGPPGWTPSAVEDVQSNVEKRNTSAEGYWDLAHCGAHLPFVDSISDEKTRFNCMRALTEAARILSLAQPGTQDKATVLTRSWIHGDLHEDNILVSREGSLDDLSPEDLTLVDWDDSVLCFTACEVAISLAYCLMRVLDEHLAGKTGGSSAAALEGMAAGAGSAVLYSFTKLFPLTTSDVDVLLPFLKARLAVSLISSARASAAAVGSTAAGASAHAGPAARLLDWLYSGGDARAFALTAAWQQAAEEGRACHTSGSGNKYREYPSLDLLSEEQTKASTDVMQWLQDNGRASGFHSVIACPVSPGVDINAPVSTSAGKTPTSHAWPTQRITDRDTQAWPAAPFVYDFTGSTPANGEAEPALIEVVGTGDAARLAKFEHMMLHPLHEDGSNKLIRLGWGRYGENRVIYTSEHFTGGATSAEKPAVEPRTVHLGVDVEAPAGTPVCAPIDAVVHSWAYNGEDLDYGPCTVLEHTVEVNGMQRKFYTLYGHLSLRSIFSDGPADDDVQGVAAVRSLYAASSSAAPVAAGACRFTPRLRIGQKIKAGEVIAWLGANTVNGGWPPHVHFQVQTELDMGGWAGDYPGVCRQSDFKVYQLLTPDPNIILRCPWITPVGPWSP